LIVFDCKVFHSERCLAKFKADLVHPTPDGADLTGIADHAAMPATKPAVLVFDSPTRAATATKTASVAAAKSKAPPKQKLAAQRRRLPRSQQGLLPGPVVPGLPATSKWAWPTVEFSETTQLFVDRVPVTGGEGTHHKSTPMAKRHKSITE